MPVRSGTVPVNLLLDKNLKKDDQKPLLESENFQGRIRLTSLMKPA